MHTARKGILLLNKPRSKTSFSLVHCLRRILGERTIGHTGTLDPLATGVMVMLIGKQYTKLSNQLLSQEKEYTARIHIGISTDTYDAEGRMTKTHDKIPDLEEIQKVLCDFQGTILQVPPMFSAKKQGGKKLYDLARKGIEVARAPCPVEVQTTLLAYAYPYLDLKIVCSKGTYIRSIAHDLGEKLGTGAHLSNLERTRSGDFHIRDCYSLEEIALPDFNWEKALIPLIRNNLH